uniref:Uncharacterized protein n=1 Tax=Mycena chlorophos TaxID=658473 RepID=A0ABQ0KTW2_MYCCL|nr:predicted protein [Mycena chlorophos]
MRHNEAMSEDPRLPTVRAISDLPAISAEQYQHVGRYAGAAVMHVFEQIGGAARMTAWADQNPTDFYTKLFPKMISRSQQVDVSATLTIDDAIDRLERQNNLITTEFTEVEDATFYDL